ncbi:hypothetical protein CLU81_0540 [Flavobacterium sp. 9]|uniref:hypothetical protein n=1 Tax=Flavobacterium sp. 9 TaxID=2035198 RepID=UPI000C19CF37|nr:hypothetical protein [Flavobacterium sp. 9]PIF30136.1 hypothetical protein CLU81_0540 [Flavobacterium sp. 9]
MKKVLCLFLILGLISCVKDVKSEVKGVKVEEKRKQEDIGLFDKGDIFSVYTLSKKTTAIVVEVFYDGQKQTNFENIFEHVALKDSLYEVFDGRNSKGGIKKSQYFDTLGVVKLIKSKLLETEIKKIIKDKYYIYGTRGFSEMNVGEIVCGIDQCKSNFIAFTIRDFDTVKNGKPIFCSSKLLKLNYGKKYSLIEKKIKRFYDSKRIEYDYTDNMNEKVFANIGSMYFSYSDDFQWCNPSIGSKCLYPGRGIYKIKNDKAIEVIWSQSLDLFGIPCD